MSTLATRLKQKRKELGLTQEQLAKRNLKSLGVNPEHAACVTVSGNSMEPILPDGATIGIDTSQTTIKDGKVYAMRPSANADTLSTICCA